MKLWRTAMTPMVLALCVTPHDALAQSDSEREAEAHFNRGVAEARGERWPSAVAAFERAYAMAALPATLFNLAEARVGAGQLRAALDTYRAYLRSAGTTASPRYVARANAQIEALTNRLCRVSLDVTPRTTEVHIDGELVAPEAREVELDPGPHAITLRAVGYEADARTLTLRDGERATLAVHLAQIAPVLREIAPPAPPPPPPIASPPDLLPRYAFQLSAIYQGLIEEDGWGSGFGIRIGLRLNGSLETFGAVSINRADGVTYTVGGLAAAYVFSAARRVPVLVGASLGVLIPDCSTGCALTSDPTRSAETDLTALGIVGVRVHFASWFALALDASVGAARLTADFPYPLIYFSLGPQVSLGM
jgi:hypothetical protein